MCRFYETKKIQNTDGVQHYATLKNSRSEIIDVPIESEIYELLNDLQREHWKLERRESRHSVHIECIPDCFLPHETKSSSPEQQLINRYESMIIATSLQQLPEKQCKRFFMRYVLNYSVKQIAFIEGCSKRSIEYSLSLAKKNLRSALSDIEWDILK